LNFSLRRLLRRDTTESPASASARRQARAFVDQGVAADNSGNAAKAQEYFRRAVAADDAYAPAHMNLGLALQAAGELPAAIASYERAIAAEPEYAAAHYNLARAHLLHGQSLQAETAFRTALRWRDDFPEAWVGLAGALEALGRDEDALAALDKATALRSDYVGALLNGFLLLRKLGRHEDAAAKSRRVLESEPENHLAHGTLAMSLHNLGRLADAETSYRRALTFNPNYTEAKANLALLLQATGRIPESVALLMDALTEDPTHVQWRRSLAEALSVAPLHRAGARKRKVLLSLCQDENLLGFLLPSIVAVIKGDEGFQALQKSARQGDDPFTAVVPAVAAFLRDPFLLAALPHMQMVDASLEEVFTHLRRNILLRFKSGEAVDPQVPADFICALARQCFYWGYAFFVAEDEVARLTHWLKVAHALLDEPVLRPRTLEPSLAVVALYDSLHHVQGSARLLACPMAEWSEAFRPIVREQIENRKREREIAMQLTAITPIDDEISKAVRAQYEDNPYPRWVTLPSSGTDTIEALSKRLLPNQDIRTRPRPVPVLIAGCGTGRQPISFARAYPDSQILSIDLSLASLAYAARMTERFGLTNLTYRQGDILKLGSLDARFAVIECCGVLHHLDDPMAGWRTLVGLLEPDGLMRIALYSEKARYAFQGAKDFARQGRFPATPDGIRACRHAIMLLPDGHPARNVLAWADFFSLDGCRDMIMHVQEHQFTLPRIEQCLDQLGLQFLGFECTAETSSRFSEMFPGGDANTNLEAWDAFERAYPNTFAGMYCFWCCRR